MNSETNAQWYDLNVVSVEDEQKKVKEMCQDLQKRMVTLEQQMTTLQAENLRLVNRILEAEIAVERYKNLLLRKNICFPFSPMLSSRLHPSNLEM